MICYARKIQQRRAIGEEQGFTLIELLIVIIVLGILAAIVVFALGSVTQQSAVAACNADAKTVSIAVSAYETENTGSIPTSVSQLVSPAAGITGGPFLKTAPNNGNYSVLLDGTGNVLVSFELNVASTVTGTAATAPAGNTPVAPGAKWLDGNTITASAATAIGGDAELYEGGTAFAWKVGGTGNDVPATDIGQNICAGA